jgi:hypothetical protein
MNIFSGRLRKYGSNPSQLSISSVTKSPASLLGQQLLSRMTVFSTEAGLMPLETVHIHIAGG